MISQSARFLVTAAVVVTAAVHSPAAAGAQAGGASVHLLDVPYLPQSEELCGGAALAMVMRYWGVKNVYAETFANLVDRSAGGIRGEDLLTALRTRGWQAASQRGDAAFVQAQLAARKPLVALIEDRPGLYHYVVVVGWTGGRVVVHDPARAPFRVLDEKAFAEAWSKTGNWSLIATPPASLADPAVGSNRPAAAETIHDTRVSSCDAMVTEGVRLAGADDREGAVRLFELASEACPRSAAPWRESAGLHALRNEWREAAAAARRALTIAPDDALAARILATSLFVQDDADGALAAWNRVGEPIVDLVDIAGLDRTRYAVVARLLDLEPQSLLDRPAIEAARRRLADLPSAQTTRLTYKPDETGRARVEAVVLERPLFPSTPVSIAAIGARAMTDRELAVSLASPSGGGELWTAAWRWWERRPRAAIGFTTPSPLGGVWGVALSTERQTYAEGAETFGESRLRAAFRLSDWTRAGTRWEAEAGVDRWRDIGRALSLSVAVQQRLAKDRAFVEARAGGWGGGVSAWTLGLRTEWRSDSRQDGAVLIGRAGVDATANGAPLALWPGASTGQGRDVLLRAHPLLDDGVVRDGVFGRRLAHAGGEWRQWRRFRRTPLRLAPAVFLDAARAGGVAQGFDRRFQMDAGAGVRIAVPAAGVLRVDVARGLRDGAMALSAGWTR